MGRKGKLHRRVREDKGGKKKPDLLHNQVPRGKKFSNTSGKERFLRMKLGGGGSALS